jgi:hypothetical protein
LVIESRNTEEMEDGDEAQAQKDPYASGEDSCTRSYLNLVDLAGSERQKATGTTGSALKEGANINKSLLALGDVINKLCEAGKKSKGKKDLFIPYRNSKLTRILKSSLGGNTLTAIICAVSPANGSRQETSSTLFFGINCKNIKNSARSNEIVDDRTLIKQLKAQVESLKKDLSDKGPSGGGGSSVDFLAVLKDMDTNGDTVPIALYKELNSAKTRLEGRLTVLEQVAGSSGTGDATSVTAALQERDNLKERCTQQEEAIRSLELDLSEHESNKSELELEQYHREEAMADEGKRVAREREQVQEDRLLVMQERSVIDEKSSRLGAGLLICLVWSCPNPLF